MRAIPMVMCLVSALYTGFCAWGLTFHAMSRNRDDAALYAAMAVVGLCATVCWIVAMHKEM